MEHLIIASPALWQALVFVNIVYLVTKQLITTVSSKYFAQLSRDPPCMHAKQVAIWALKTERWQTGGRQ